jgi:hypothetical protein
MELKEIFAETNHILVFRSNIDDKYKASKVCARLEKVNGVLHANIDLDDWENILRLECDSEINEHRIRQIVSQSGFECEKL